MNVKLLSVVLVLLMVVLGEASALDSNQQAEMVEAHNQYRSEVGVSSRVS